MKRTTLAWTFAMLPAACGDDGTLAEASGSGSTETAESSEGGTAGTTSATTTGNTSASGTGTTAADSTDGSTADASSGATDASTGGTGACEGPGNCSIYPAPCEPDMCGTLDSPWDENGCLREACGIGDACARGERCYHAQWFGGCASSGISCEDDAAQRMCVCGSLPDCSGAYCVPDTLWPTPETGPTEGQIDDACAPDDGPATELMFGGLGSCPMDEPMIRLVFFSGGPAVGSYLLESQSHGFGEVVQGGELPVGVTAAWVEITALGGGTASGSYEVITDDAQHLAADFADIPYCEGGFPCG